MDYNEYIESHITYCEYTRRGGTIKIDVSELFPEIEEDAIMGASQNYLGGGLLGSVHGGSMFDPRDLTKEHQIVFEELKEEVKRYFFAKTNEEAGEYDEWNEQSYERNQSMPVSAY